MVPTGVRPGLCRRPRWAATSNSSSESARGPPNDQGTLVSLAPHRLPADDLCAPGQAPASRAGSADVNKKDGSSHGACSLWARLTLLLHEVHTPLAVTQAPPTPPHPTEEAAEAQKGTRFRLYCGTQSNHSAPLLQLPPPPPPRGPPLLPGALPPPWRTAHTPLPQGPSPAGLCPGGSQETAAPGYTAGPVTCERLWSSSWQCRRRSPAGRP